MNKAIEIKYVPSLPYRAIIAMILSSVVTLVADKDETAVGL